MGWRQELCQSCRASKNPFSTLSSLCSSNLSARDQARPLSTRERVEEASPCVQALDKEQIKLGSKYFTFDMVYDADSQQEVIYDDCVRELVRGCLKGYNATVLAYGQTGSGKTYTMGSTSIDAMLEDEQGIIPRAIRQLFDDIKEQKVKQPDVQYKIHVSFLEIYNEEIKDLLDNQPHLHGKHKNISLREGPNGSIVVTGVTEEPVETCEEMFHCLERGTVCRSVGSTSMNSVSSRSHAIFTVTIEQSTDMQFSGSESEGGAQEGSQEPHGSSSITSKFHFVDLAGSERAKRTQAAGERLKEGININYGLLVASLALARCPCDACQVLGNVISALGDESRKGSHVPYRDSKLTRMLQDSIGGNSRTLMIACISPADSNFAESYNTLVYANRARNIKNKPVVNRDPREAQLEAMKDQILRLKSERDVALKQAGLSVHDLQGLLPEVTGERAMFDLGPADEAVRAELKQSQQDNVSGSAWGGEGG
eukprot:754936-Hanusia_phi.AAC.5